ncbi:MAG: hypothetical protein ACJAUC_004930, partial [Planctomycetota bacterium]
TAWWRWPVVWWARLVRARQGDGAGGQSPPSRERTCTTADVEVATWPASRDLAEVRTLPAIALLLAACQSTKVPAEAGLERQLASRAIAFATAVEAGDFLEGSTYAAPSAKGFFEAQVELKKMQWDEREPRPPAGVSLKSTSHEGARGVAVVTMSRGGETQDLTFFFDLVNGVWGAVAYSSGDSSDMRLFADREKQFRDVIERAVKDATPYPELGAFVTAYLAAAANKDKAGMTASMAPECVKSEEHKNSFTSGFLAGRIKVKRWQFSRHEVDGDTVVQYVRTLLELPDGETDNDAMRFSFEKAATGWVMTGIS